MDSYTYFPSIIGNTVCSQSEKNLCTMSRLLCRMLSHCSTSIGAAMTTGTNAMSILKSDLTL